MGSRENPRKVITKLQCDLHEAQREILRLKKVVQDLKKGKERLISRTEHEHQLEVVEERASRAEMKALAFESELNKKYVNGLYKSTPIIQDIHLSSLSEPEEVPPEIPQTKPLRKHGRKPCPEPRYRRRKSVGIKGDYGSSLRRMSSTSSILARKDSSKQRKSAKRRLDLNCQKPKAHRTLIKAVQNILRPNGHRARGHRTHSGDGVKKTAGSVNTDVAKGGKKGETSLVHRKSLLMRVHTRFFSRRKKLRSIYDLPDLSNLADCNFTEYEIPIPCFEDFEKTPLVGKSFRRE